VTLLFSHVILLALIDEWLAICGAEFASATEPHGDRAPTPG
jgi:hypothetical protein